jgi:hypothetical protein
MASMAWYKRFKSKNLELMICVGEDERHVCNRVLLEHVYEYAGLIRVRFRDGGDTFVLSHACILAYSH